LVERGIEVTRLPRIGEGETNLAWLLMLPRPPGPVSATLSPLPNHAVVDVRPGDLDTATEVGGWLQEYAVSRDPQPQERIVLAYLGLADRLAGRYRTSRGTTPEDLVQVARAGLIAAVDRYDPDYGTPFVPYAVACGRRTQTAPA
jgi:Sigma-70 region 2